MVTPPNSYVVASATKANHGDPEDYRKLQDKKIDYGSRSLGNQYAVAR